MKSYFAMTATLLVALSACSDGEQTCDPPPDDGKYHPEPNGERLAEQPACDQLYAAIDARRDELKCVGTLTVCPNFLASQYGAGKEYDVGTLDACVVYVQGANCDQLKAPHDCVLTFYPEPEEACAE